jgi:FAD/FMN-containing dehydrogenase
VSAPDYPISTADLHALAERVRGRVVLPEATDYDDCRVLFNSVYDYVRPLAIVQAADTQDVARTIEFASANGIALVPKSGGHSFAGYCTGPGIVLDVSPMKAVTIGAEGKSARIGSGAKLLDVLTPLAAQGRAVPSGFCPTVGIAGVSLGGGIGRLSRMYGLTLDWLRGVEVVTADAKVVRADANTNPDLFWAHRGGGGGNFGVVTALDFETAPIPPPVVRYAYGWPWTALYGVFAAWQQWSNASPHGFQSDFTLSTGAPGGTPTVSVEGTYLGSLAQAQPHLDELEASVNVKPTVRQIDSTDYATAIKDVFCQGLTDEQCRLLNQGGKVNRYGTAIKSTFVTGTWPVPALDVITEWIERRQADPVMTRDPASSNLGKIWFDSVGGAVSSVAPEATAYVHRDATFCGQYQSRWDPAAPTATREANIQWLREFHAAMEPWNSGAYVNYTDPDLVDWQQKYYGANYPRLQSVKAKWDPHGFFTFPQGIVPV